MNWRRIHFIFPCVVSALFFSCDETLEEKYKEPIRRAPNEFTLMEKQHKDCTYYNIRERTFFMDVVGIKTHFRENGYLAYQPLLSFRVQANKKTDTPIIWIRFEDPITEKNYELDYRWDSTAIGDITINGKMYDNVRYYYSDSLKVFLHYDKGFLKVEAGSDHVFEQVGL